MALPAAPIRVLPAISRFLPHHRHGHRPAYSSRYFFMAAPAAILSLSCHLPVLSSSIPAHVAISQKAVSTVADRDSVTAHAESFFACEHIAWKTLGLADDIIDALERASLQRPSAVQAVAIPAILEGGDVVMAAETGSGKTQAYLAPLFTKLLKQRTVNGLQIDMNQAHLVKRQEFALILCPNTMLCEQVATMGNALCDSNRTPLLKISVVSGGQGWPISPPDIVVATPAALLNHLFAYDPKRRRRNAFVRDVKFVVFDEADMLLSGSFENQVMRLVHLFRYEEKEVAKSRAHTSTNDNADVKPWTDFLQVEVTSDDASDREDNEDSEQTESSAVDETIIKQRDWQRSRKSYTRSKQYVFAAATLPDNGRKTPGAILKKLVPEAKWVSGEFLHRRNPRLEEHWVEVSSATQVQALLDALSSGATQFKKHPVKTLVFANSVDAVDAICRILQKAAIECLCYHRETTSEERSRNLKVFEEDGGILVCTDSAARGLDITNVNHVIQAEFAKTAVDYIHRVGRTARAGQFGAVTSLYTKENLPLVKAVKEAEEAGLSVESVFSRKRSFRNKLKKAGMNNLIQ